MGSASQASGLQCRCSRSERGLTRTVGATVSHILAVPLLVATTDLIAFVPRQLVLQFRDQGLVFCELPYESPPLRMAMLSHRRMGAHPSVAWLRRTLAAVAGQADRECE